MLESFKKVFYTSVVTSILFMILGLFLLFEPETIITTISYIIGSLIIAIGTIFLIKYFNNRQLYGYFSGDLLFGVMSVIFGLILILNPKTLAEIIPYIIGIWIIVSSVTKLQYSLHLKAYNQKAWISTMVIAVITFIWGLLLLFKPFESAIEIVQLIGIFILVYAILDLIEVILIKKNLKDFQKDGIEIIT